MFSGQKVKSDGGMTWKLSANPDGKNPSSHLHHKERKDKEKTKQKTEKPHDQTNPAPLAWEGRAVLGDGGEIAQFVLTRRRLPGRRPPTHGVKMGEKGMFS